VVDDIVYLINRDAAAFWSRTTGAPASELARRRVPLATARSLVRSLFMVFPETQDRCVVASEARLHGHDDAGACACRRDDARPHAFVLLLHHGTSRRGANAIALWLQ
jgi:hypothetical protein